MPYIQDTTKKAIDGGLEPTSAGELAYAATKLVNQWINKLGASYRTYSMAVGVLETVKLELYRRVIASYEDLKCKDNGDVY